MEVTTSRLSSLPADLLSPILDLIGAYEICYLLFCGDQLLVRRFLKDGIVKSLNYIPKSPLNAKWPSLVSMLPNLLTLDFRMPFYYSHMPITLPDRYQFPKSVKKVHFQFGNANQAFDPLHWHRCPELQHIYLNGHRAPRPSISVGGKIESLGFEGFTTHLSSYGSLTSIDIDLYISAGEINDLPANLTNLCGLKLVALNDDDATRETLNQVVLPPNLVRLHIDCPGAGSIFLKKLPPTVTDLAMTTPDPSGELLWPPKLSSLSLYSCLYIGLEAWKMMGSLWRSLPRGLISLKTDFGKQTMIGCTDLPPSLTKLALHRIYFNFEMVSVLPPTLRILNCHIGRFETETNELRLNFPHLERLTISNAHFSVPFYPSTLTKLKGQLYSLEELQSVPETLTHLDAQIDEMDSSSNWMAFLPPSLTYLRITSNPGLVCTLPSKELLWPAGLEHLILDGIECLQNQLFAVPPGLVHFAIYRVRRQSWDTAQVLKNLPPTLTKLTFMHLKVIDEDVPLLPPNLVDLEVQLEITIASCKLLPPTLRRLARFHKPMDYHMEDMLPEYCIAEGSRAW
jgi:hypothetical protein